MDFILKEVPICADKEFEMIKITDDVRKVVEESGVEKGIVYVITEHTTTGITVNESLPCVEKDLMECLDRIAPEDYPYHHNHYLPTYGTIGGNAPGHLKSLLTGNHCVFPVLDGTLKLGHAVDIYFCEYDGIKNRRYMVYVVGEKVLTGAEYTAYHVGTDGKKYYYTYHVSEMKVDGYTTEITYKGDRQYSITVTNTKNWFDSLLPETGGMGKALLYTLGVLLLCLVTATEYRKRKSTRSQSSYK